MSINKDLNQIKGKLSPELSYAQQQVTMEDGQRLRCYVPIDLHSEYNQLPGTPPKTATTQDILDIIDLAELTDGEIDEETLEILL